MRRLRLFLRLRLKRLIHCSETPKIKTLTNGANLTFFNSLKDHNWSERNIIGCLCASKLEMKNMYVYKKQKHLKTGKINISQNYSWAIMTAPTTFYVLKWSKSSISRCGIFRFWRFRKIPSFLREVHTIGRTMLIMF